MLYSHPQKMFRFFMLLVSLWIAHAQLGGWSKADPNAADVQEAATFAVGKKYYGEHPVFSVVQARKQVVAGMNYDLIVDVTANQKCHVEHYQVYNRFGTLSVTQSDVLDEHCKSGGK